MKNNFLKFANSSNQVSAEIKFVGLNRPFGDLNLAYGRWDHYNSIRREIYKMLFSPFIDFRF